MKKKKYISTIDRMSQLLEYFETLPAGQEVNQFTVIKALGIAPGQWSEVTKWLNGIIMIQGRPNINRRFIPTSTSSAKFKTLYSRGEDELL